jgi:Transglycosylase SLT domain
VDAQGANTNGEGAPQGQHDGPRIVEAGPPFGPSSGLRAHNLGIARSIREPARTQRRRQRLVAAALLVALIAGGVSAVLVALTSGGKDPLFVPRPDVGTLDPLAFSAEQETALERSAAFGLAHVLYTKSPGGVLVAAERTASFRPLVERAAAGSGIDPDLLEAIVFLESGGRPEVIAGSDPANAAGLTQILVETGRDFLHMQVELAASRKLTRNIDAALRRGDEAAAERLRARRRRVDARFDPARALAGAVRYLTTARARFGRNDLAAVSYHMGIGNLQSVLRDYAGAPNLEPITEVVANGGLSWARLYFDASPAHHTAAWRRLAGFGDDSQTYYWRVLAAKEIMHLYRHDRDELERLVLLQNNKTSAEEVLHPPDTTQRFHDPGALEHGWRARRLQPLPNEPARLHLRIDPQMGELARRLGKDRSLYRGLRPEALALLLYLADRVHALSGEPAPLVVTSTVRDDAYQRLLDAANPEATPNYSLHTTGYAFDILRRYGSRAQTAAFQYELERLQARGLIAWVRQPKAIHITVSSKAKALVDSMLEPAQPGRQPTAPSDALLRTRYGT